jgi:hypothetical protein
MLRAFQAMREVHGLLALLQQASRLDLTPAERETLADLNASLQPEGEWNADALSRAPMAEITARVRALLAPFRDVMLRGAGRARSESAAPVAAGPGRRVAATQ